MAITKEQKGEIVKKYGKTEQIPVHRKCRLRF